MTAAAAISANATGAQAVEGSARQGATAASASGGGLFSALLAELLQTNETALSQDMSGPQSASTTPQGTQIATENNAVQQGPALPNALSLQNQSQTQPGQSQPLPTSNSLPAGMQIQQPGKTFKTNSSTLQATLSACAAVPNHQSNAQSTLAAAQPQVVSEPNVQNTQTAAANLSTAPFAVPIPALAQPATEPAGTSSSSDVSTGPVGAKASAPQKFGPVGQELAALDALQSANQSQGNSQLASSSAANSQQTPSPVANSQAANASPSPSSVSTSANAASTPPNNSGAASTTPIFASLSAIQQTIQSAIAATPAPNNGQRQTFAQATQNAAHQNTAASVTEAKALPLDPVIDAQGGASSQPQLSHAATPDDSQTTQQQPTVPGDPAVSANVQPIAAHDAAAQNPGSMPVQNSASPQVPTMAMSAQASTPAPANTFTLQVGPASQTPGAAAQPNVQALAVSIASQSLAGAKQFNIRLDPPELGRVDVRLTVDTTGKAQAHLAADKPQTLELLQRDSGSLARALKDSGVQLNNNGLQFSLKGQDRQGNDAMQRGRPLAATVVPASTSSTSAASVSSFAASSSGVDIRV